MAGGVDQEVVLRLVAVVALIVRPIEWKSSTYDAIGAVEATNIASGTSHTAACKIEVATRAGTGVVIHQLQMVKGSTFRTKRTISRLTLIAERVCAHLASFSNWILDVVAPA